MRKKTGVWRYNLILIFILIAASVIFYRLAVLQIVRGDFYQAQALGQQTRLTEKMGERGSIFFNDETKILAFNKDNWRVFASPYEIKNKEEAAEKLSIILSEEKNDILSKIENEKFYVVIKNELSDSEIKKIKELGLQGIYLEKYPSRYYPQESLASHVAGFLGGDGIGQYGLEGYYEDALSGMPGFEEKRKGILGYLFDSGNLEADIKGKDLYLSLDYSIQFKAESLLKEAKELYNIEGGQIIVMIPSTGEIIALAHLPTFNPNQYWEVKDLNVFQNGAIQKKFEPGSVFKAITMAMALNEGKVTPETTYIDKGFVKVGIETIYNYDKRTWGERTMTEVLERSINTGAVFAQQQLSKNVFLDYIAKFGFDEKTGIDLQGEICPSNANLKKGRDINFATASFGQGIEMTPIQLLRAFSAITNGGNLVKPFIVKKIVDSSGKEIITEPKVTPGIISKKTASQLTTMLISVVESSYTKNARVPGYYIAGKTGTAQVPLENEEGYHPNKTIQSFVGFGPALNPKFLILVKLNNPQTKTAEYSAVPVFQKLAKYIIDYWQIPPDYET